MSGWAVSPFPWFGGKQRLARRIVDLLPPRAVYVEPFGGAAAVLLSKMPSRLEVYNDVDEGLLSFFRALRDAPEEIERRLRLTPFARREFEICRDTWREQDDPIEKARRWYVRVEQAFAGTPTTMGWGGEYLGRRRQSRATSSWKRLDRMYLIAERFRTVQIEALDWRKIFDRIRDLAFRPGEDSMNGTAQLFRRLIGWLLRRKAEQREATWPIATLRCVRHPLEHPTMALPLESYPVGYPNIFGPPRTEPHCECGALMYVAASEVIA